MGGGELVERVVVVLVEGVAVALVEGAVVVLLEGATVLVEGVAGMVVFDGRGDVRDFRSGCNLTRRSD